MDYYIVLIHSGDALFLLGRHGEYLRNINNALKFNDIVEAKEYIERRGIEKIAMTRRVRIA